MKTNPNNSTCSTSACHNGSANADTKAIYEITFSYKQRGKRYLKASSPAEARRKAARIPGQVGFWQDYPETYNAETLVEISPDEIPSDAIFVEIPD